MGPSPLTRSKFNQWMHRQNDDRKFNISAQSVSATALGIREDSQNLYSSLGGENMSRANEGLSVPRALCSTPPGIT